jgi:[acyl-carrier-protein] S-malonyltransferase
MAPAAEAMREALANVSFAAPCVRVVANVIASAETSPDKLRDLLVQQVTGVVRWRESMHYLKAQGVTKAIEIGAGKVLSGMVKRIEPEIECNNIGVPADLTSLAKAA